MELHDVGVVECLVQFDFIGESEPGAVGAQFILGNDLGGGQGLGGCVLGNETVREPTFAEESAFQVFAGQLSAVYSADVLGYGVFVLVPLFGRQESAGGVGGSFFGGRCFLGFAETHRISIFSFLILFFKYELI